MRIAAAALLLVLAWPQAADAARCRKGQVYIIHAHACVGHGTRLARLYVGPRRRHVVEVQTRRHRVRVVRRARRVRYVRVVEPPPRPRPIELAPIDGLHDNPSMPPQVEVEIELPYFIAGSRLNSAPTVHWVLPRGGE